jgi:hemolysin activation/secretion protein
VVIKKYHGSVLIRLSAVLLAFLLAINSTEAQTTDGSPSSGPRNGPKAEPLPTPPYLKPTSPIAPTSPAAPPSESKELGPVLEFSDVNITPVPEVRTPARAKIKLLKVILASLKENPIADLEVIVRPNEALDAAWVRRQFRWNDMIGHETAAARVVALVLTLNEIFLANGNVNSGLLLTAQGWPDKGGILQLQLIIGRIIGKAGEPKITVEWAKDDSNGLTADYVLGRLPAATRMPFDSVALENEFRLLAEDPAIRMINAQLNPGEQPGEASLSLSVDPAPRFDSRISVADSRSPSVGGDRVAVDGLARNSIIAGDLLSAGVGVTSGMTDGTVSYSAPLTPDTEVHARFSADGAAVVDEAFRSLGIHSIDKDWEVGVSHALLAIPLTPIGETGVRSPAESLKVGLILASRESTSTLLGQPFSFSPGEVNGKSNYNVLRTTVDWVERSDQQVLAFSGIVSFGLQGSGSDVAAVTAPSPNFKTLLVQGNYARRLNRGSLELHVRFEGQAASGVLYSGERLAVGGESTVRGYRENLLLADDGGVGSVEVSCAVRFDILPCGAAANDWKTVQVSIFVDGAYVSNAAAPQPVPHAIESVGASLAWTFLDKISARITYGYALNYVPPVGKLDLQDRGIIFEVVMHPLNLFDAQ